ncbi:MAG TPA: family 78 glycoside hydrolase catalytic domain [Planctomycetota bacterium]|nr:family 78 glycoside hydrolase catalytic domain [Planctomycetota bacterium]
MLTDLRCESRIDPIGLGETAPRFSWRWRAERRGERQTAWQVLVAASPEALAADRGDRWDSGRVDGDASNQIAYAGTALASRARCWWKARAWDRDGRATPWTPPASFELGLLSGSDWQARWIALDATRPPLTSFAGAQWIWHGDAAGAEPGGSRWARRRFVIAGTPRRAELLFSVDDQVRWYVNGTLVFNSVGQGYSWQVPVTLDLKPHLKPGENVIAAELIGWKPERDANGLAANLVVDADAPLALVSDASWRTTADKADGWASPAHDDRAWKPARVVAPFGAGRWGDLKQKKVNPGVHLRGAFRCAKPVARARLHATALGCYVPHLNGQRVGDEHFAPGWTDYHTRVQHQTWDVTALVRAGDNAVGATLGEGWFAGHLAHVGRNVYGDLPKLRMQLEIEHDDGTRTVVASDGSWRGAAGAILESDMLMGETYDARVALPGWSAPGFAATGWTAPTVHDVATTVEPQRDPPVRAMIELPARARTQPTPGTWIHDLGQNLVGWARLRVAAPAGTRVQLRFAEMLNPDGTMYVANLRTARATDTYVCAGGGVETWEPAFTFHGFRYVELTGLPGEPFDDAVTGIVVHTDTPPTGALATGHALVDQLASNILWGQRGNFLSLPTDCPQRNERMGWTGDAQIFARTAAYHMDVASFFAKWLVDVVDGQRADGAVHDVAPWVAGVGDGNHAWADAIVIVPHVMWQCYGDLRIAGRAWPGMVAWIEHCRRESTDLVRPATGYGDWLSIDAETPKEVSSTAYFAWSTGLMAELAQALGKTDEAESYRRLHAQITTAFNRAFVKADGAIHGDTQAAYAFAIRFGLLPEALVPAAAQRLRADVERRGWRLSTGFIGVRELLPALTDTGHVDAAYRLLVQDAFPSWGYSITHGATTIWERWNGWTSDGGFFDPGMNSFNHYSLGSVGEWMYGHMAGIAPAAPGYARIRIQPHPDPTGAITRARAELASPRGLIVSSWIVADGRFTLDVVIPANASAEVRLPCADPTQAREADKPLGDARAERGATLVAIGSGTYRFTCPWSAVAKQAAGG